MSDATIREVLEFLVGSLKGSEWHRRCLDLLEKQKKEGKFRTEWVDVCFEGLKSNDMNVCRTVVFAFLEVYNHKGLSFMIENMHVIDKLAVEMSRMKGKTAGAIAIEVNQLVMTLFQREGRRYSPVHGETSLLLFQTLFNAAVFARDEASKEMCCQSLHQIARLLVSRVEDPNFETEEERVAYLCSRKIVWNVMKGMFAEFTAKVPTSVVTDNVFDNDVVMLARSLYCSILARQHSTQSGMAIECDRISFSLLATLFLPKHVAMKAVLQFLFVVKTELTALMIRDPGHMDVKLIPEFMDFNFRLIENYREILKHETFLFVKSVFLRILKNDNVVQEILFATLEKFESVPVDVVIECFVNLDGYVESINVMKDVILKLVTIHCDPSIRCITRLISQIREKWASGTAKIDPITNDSFVSWTKCKRQPIGVAFKQFVENGLPYSFPEIDKAVTEFSMNYAAENSKSVFWTYEKIWAMLVHLCELKDETMSSIIEQADETKFFPYSSISGDAIPMDCNIDHLTLRSIVYQFRTVDRIVKEMDHRAVEFFLNDQKSPTKEYWKTSFAAPTVRSFLNDILPAVTAFCITSQEILKEKGLFQKFLLDLLAIDFVFYVECCSEDIFPHLDRDSFVEAIEMIRNHPIHRSSTWKSLLESYGRLGGVNRNAITEMTFEMPSISVIDFISVLCNFVVDESTTQTHFHDLLMQVLERNAKREFIVWMNIWFRLSTALVDMVLKEETGSAVTTIMRVIALRLRSSNISIPEDQQSLFIPIETLLKKAKTVELRFKLLTYTQILIETQSSALNNGWRGVFRVIETAATVPKCNRRALLILIEIYERYLNELITTDTLKSSFDASFSFVFFRTRYAFPASLVIIGAIVSLLNRHCELKSFEISVDCLRRTLASQDIDAKIVPELKRLTLSGDYLTCVSRNLLTVLVREKKESPTLIDILDIFFPTLVREAPTEALDVILSAFPTINLPLISFCSKYIHLMKDVKGITEAVTKIISQGMTAFELDVDDEKVSVFSLICVNMAPYSEHSRLGNCVRVLKPYAIQLPIAAKAYIICLSFDESAETVARQCNRLMVLGEPFAAGVLEAVLLMSDDEFKVVSLLIAKQASDYIQKSGTELRRILKEFFSRVSDLLHFYTPV